MDEPQPSRVMQDIIALERDFRHNLALLKIRETEIERCNTINKSLQETVDSTVNQVEVLNMKVLHLKNEQANKDENYRQDMKRAQSKIRELEKVIEQYRSNEKMLLESCSNDLRNKQEQMEVEYNAKLASTVSKLDQQIIELQRKLEEQKKNAAQLKNRIDEAHAEKKNIKAKASALEARNMSDQTYYKAEIKALRKACEDLETELKREREKNQQINSEVDNIIKEDVKLKAIVNGATSAMTNLSEENRKLMAINEQFRSKLDLSVSENNKLKVKLNELKQMGDQVGPNNSLCNVREHQNYEHVIKQNKVLQEIIKSMKKGKQESSISISNLEDLVDCLKSNMTKNYPPHMQCPQHPPPPGNCYQNSDRD